MRENVTKGIVETIQWDDPKLSGLEPYLLDIGRSLVGEGVQETDQKKSATIQRKAKKFMIWNDNLFRREKDVQRAVPPIGQDAEVLTTFYDDIGH